MKRVGFSDVDSGLERAKSNMRAAEAHGVLCGLISGGGAVSHKEWLNLLLDEWDEHDALMKEIIQNLSILHVSTLQDLNDSDLKFFLFLPDDNEKLIVRVNELSNWCQGFLFGIGLHSNNEMLNQHEQVLDAITDIKDIGNVKQSDEDDADENDFVEVVEYLRMAVLMIYDTLQPVKATEIQVH